MTNPATAAPIRPASGARDLPAPVGELGDLAAQPLERVRRARRGWPRSRRGSPQACGRASGSCGLRVRGRRRSRWIRFASSIAMSGVGGAPLLNTRDARKPASAPSRNSDAGDDEEAPVGGRRRRTRYEPATRGRRAGRAGRRRGRCPAAIPTTAPRASMLRLLGASRPWRARSPRARAAGALGDLWTLAAISAPSSGCPGSSAAKALEDDRERRGRRRTRRRRGSPAWSAGDEGRRCSARRRARVAARRAGAAPLGVGCGSSRCVGVRSRHSGGSSPNARRPYHRRELVVAMLASAPSPASRPDQMSRLTISLSIAAAVYQLSRRRSPDAPRGRSPPQIVSTTKLLACSYSRSPAAATRRSSR